MWLRATRPWCWLCALPLAACTSDLKTEFTRGDQVRSSSDAGKRKRDEPPAKPQPPDTDDDAVADVGDPDVAPRNDAGTERLEPEPLPDDDTANDDSDDDSLQEPEPEPDPAEPEPFYADDAAGPEPEPEPTRDAGRAPEPTLDASAPVAPSLDAGPSDLCPDDPGKTDPGFCGCGFPEVTTCAELDSALLHRYSFDDTGTIAADSRGAAHGTVMGGTQAGGVVTLAGLQSEQYVDLPNDVLAGLVDASFEVWTTWGGGEPWQKIFDFGASDLGEDVQGVASSDLFLTPRTQTDNVLRVGFVPNGAGQMSVSSTEILPTGIRTHIVVVFDDSNDFLYLYANGAFVQRGQLPGTLAQIDYHNNWLGRSQWSGNPEYTGSIDEFRIYGSALSAEQIAYSFERGVEGWD